MSTTKTVRAPKGFIWKYKRLKSYGGTYYHTISLVNKKTNRSIGEVRLFLREEDGCYETHSDLDEEYRNRGYGTKLYAKAIQWCLKNGYKVRSSGYTSELAQRVWRGKSIRKYFRIVTKPHKSPYSNETDSMMDVFHAYRKPKRR